MRRPLPAVVAGDQPPVVTTPDPEVNEPDSACDASSPRRVIAASWLPEQSTLPKNSEDDTCTPVKTTYHCSVVTVCAVGGTQTPVISDAPDKSCVDFLGPGTKPPVFELPH